MMLANADKDQDLLGNILHRQGTTETSLETIYGNPENKTGPQILCPRSPYLFFQVIIFFPQGCHCLDGVA